MEYLKLARPDGYYNYRDSNSIAMSVLGLFLISDVSRGSDCLFFCEWALDNGQDCLSGNITYLEKENGYIFLTDLYSEETEPTALQLTQKQFIHILNEWEKICKLRPSEVLIKYENGKFVIETSN